MPAIYQGDKKIVDRYVGEKLIIRAYQGDKLIFDAYSELSGTLPLTVRSRASQILKNYIIYGTASGAGVETKNLWDGKTTITIDDIGERLAIYLEPGETYTILNNSQYNVLLAYGSTKTNLSNRTVACGANSTTTINTISAYAYAAFFTSMDAVGSLITIVKGSTAPSSYIPYGYKLPLTVRTENLLDISSEAQITVPTTAAVRWGLFINIPKTGIYTLYYKVGNYGSSASLSYRVKHEGSWSIYHNTSYNDGVSSTNISLEQGDQICVYNGNMDTYKMATAQKDVMFTYGSTPPDHYIPHYNTETSIYIGDSQLMAEEYVDYEEQKVYKRTENKIDTSCSVYGYLFQNGTIKSSSVTMTTDYIPITSSVETVKFIKTGVIQSPNQRLICVYDSDKNFVNNYVMSQSGNTYTYRFTPPTNGKYYRASYDEGYGKLIGIEGSTAPEDYIPYLQPTDPPVPLPDITLPQATVTIDTEEELKSQVSVKGRINPVT